MTNMSRDSNDSTYLPRFPVVDESTPAQRLASHVGADCSRVQLMKASFFGCTEEEEQEESMAVAETQPVLARPVVASRLRRAPLTGIPYFIHCGR